MTIPPNAKLIFTSGQIGVLSDGSLAATVGEQIDLAFEVSASVLARLDILTQLRCAPQP